MTENRMSTPTLINLPPPPSDPVTPSDMGPGTPNSGTTSLSALSTTAIKDGHQGHPHPYARHTHQSSSASATSTSTLEAERADRISRLAGLERIATARAGGGGGGGGGNQNIAASLAPTVTSGHYSQQQYNPNNNNNSGYNNQQGYFDSYPQQLLKERSTVGSASATGSIGGRTTWASGSDAFDPDKMSEDQDDHDHDSSSVGGGDDVDDRMSDEGNASLVGFGEGANSTISGPISTISAPAAAGAGTGGGVPGGPVRLQSSSSTGTNPPPRPSTFGSPPGNRSSGGFGTNNPYSSIGQQQQRFFSPSPAGSNTPEPFDDARMVDGMTYDSDIVDTTVRTPRLVGGQNDQDGSGHNSPGR